MSTGLKTKKNDSDYNEVEDDVNIITKSISGAALLEGKFISNTVF